MSIQEEVVNKQNTSTFIQVVRDLTNRKLFFNKPLVKQIQVMESCFEKSREYLGKDFNFLQDAAGVRLYIRDIFGAKSLRYFEDGDGEIVLDIEHSILFYRALEAQGSDLLDAAKGVIYFIAGHQLDDEFDQISKNAPKGKITPSFELNSNYFRWRRCNFVLRKYMLSLGLPEGYTGYYFEKKGLFQIAYLCHTGMSFDDAEKTVKQATSGIVFTDLSIDEENQILPYAFSGLVDTNLMGGYYAQNYMKDADSIVESLGVPNDSTYNVYNHMVKNRMIDFMGAILINLTAEMSGNSYISDSDAFVYHLSPHRVGVAVKEGFRIEDVLPTLHPYFKAVEAFNLDDIFNGELL